MGEESSGIWQKYHDQAVCPVCGNRFSDSRDVEMHYDALHLSPPQSTITRDQIVYLVGFENLDEKKPFRVIGSKPSYDSYSYTLTLEEVK